MKGKFKAKIRIKLIIGLLSVVLIAGAGAVTISLLVIDKSILGQAYDDVQTSLHTAQYIYNKKIEVIYLFMKHLASLEYLQEAIIKNQRGFLLNKLLNVKNELDIDILNITDTEGRIIIRANNYLSYGDDLSGDVFINYVLRNRQSCYGTNIIEGADLAKESKILYDHTYIKVVPTPMARKKDKIYEKRGMVFMAAAPVFFRRKFLGVIYGARLLNNNFELVDKIKSLTFKDEKIKGFDIGTATIFMDDLRISTNVKNNDGTRAVGTQVSEEVYKKVVEQQNVWLDKAFVVNNWYISAYSPIYNVENSVIGILYVGILEEKYNAIKRNTYLYYLIMTFIAALSAIIISIYLIKNITSPIKALVRASNNIANGIYTKKLIVQSNDELGYLCAAFNKMIDAIDERDKKLKEQTERQIVQSEKLASLGRLASGIAHEINNPLTGVLGYSTALMEDLEETEYREDLQVIIDETKRCRNIVKGILDFARETKIEKEPASINTIIENSLSILARHVSFQNIKIMKNLSENMPEIQLDINQMKSVINNLTVNAADAMPDGGDLTISTYISYSDNKKREIIIEVSDTGAGISDENIGKIFDPFFSTKDVGKGTGLGLSVTKRVIERHNGKIEVRSRPGEGTTFTIHLPMD